jgi:hypothetical protein
MPNSPYAHIPRIRVGADYARRDEIGTLIETGWIDPEDGSEHRDMELDGKTPKIVASNPAAMVPWNQEWE